MTAPTTPPAVSDAISAGRFDEVAQALQATAQSAKSYYDGIQSDRTLSDTYKAEKIAEAHRKYLAEVDAKMATISANAARTDRADAAAVLGTAGLSGDPASLQILRRDATQRVENVIDNRQLSTILAKATRQGDEVLARAVVERAIDIQAAEVVNQFTADRPNLFAATERLWARALAGKPTLSQQIVVGGFLGAINPPRR